MIIQNLDLVKQLYEKQPYRTAAGLFYGYPICCIKDFIQKPAFLRQDSSHLPIYGKGYVPCDKCIILANDNLSQIIKSINQSRICKSPFPEDNDHSKLDQYFIDLTIVLGFDIEKELSTLKESDSIRELYLSQLVK